MHHRNSTAKLLGNLIEPKLKDTSRIYKGKDTKQDIYTDLNIDISYKQAWRSKNVALESISGCPESSFAQLPYYCYNLERTNDGTVTHIETDDEDRFKMVFIAFGVVIRSFKYHMRPLIIIDAAHLKGRYEGTNLLAVGMDGNNQIIPIATGVSQGETGPSWTWFLSKLKECIGEIPDLTIISDRHATILSSCGAVFPNAFHGYCCRHLMMNCKLKSIKMQCLFWKMCKAYSVDDFRMAINELEAKRPDVYQRLIEAGVERRSRAYCTHDRYNYMTSNSAESINNLTRDVRKVPITNLMEWYSNSRIETGKVYKVDDHRRVETVELCNDCNGLAKRWFMRITLKGTYQELVYPLGEVSSWQIPNNLPVVKPPVMSKPAGRPKSTKRIRSQGEEPVTVRCGRCGARGHNRQGCRESIAYTKKGRILEEAHNKQRITFINQCRGKQSTWMTIDA
ncbi:transposase, MuDR, MULE transposase domain protein [Tanacetum coccineum]